jgi:hypothetical protein
MFRFALVENENAEGRGIIAFARPDLESVDCWACSA